MSTASVRQRLRSDLAPVVEAAGYDLEDVTVTPAGRRRVVQVIVDRDGGVDLDAVAEVSRAVSEALDASDAMGSSPYVLEVSSPGVGRPLTEPRHWRRATGRLVAATLAEGGTLTGRVTGVTDDTVAIDVGGSVRSLRVADVVRGVVQVEFNRPGEPGDDGEEGPA